MSFVVAAIGAVAAYRLSESHAGLAWMAAIFGFAAILAMRGMHQVHRRELAYSMRNIDEILSRFWPSVFVVALIGSIGTLVYSFLV